MNGFIETVRYWTFADVLAVALFAGSINSLGDCVARLVINHPNKLLWKRDFVLSGSFFVFGALVTSLDLMR